MILFMESGNAYSLLFSAHPCLFISLPVDLVSDLPDQVRDHLPELIPDRLPRGAARCTF